MHLIKNPDLFGGETEQLYKGRDTIENQLKRMGYRKSDSNKKCKLCKNFITKECHNKIYFKCLLIGNSAGSATDIRANNVCNLFKN